MPEPVSKRAATVVGVAGLGLSAVLAGAVIAAGGSASAAATCAASNPSETPTTDPSATATATATDTGSPSASATANGNGTLVGGITDKLPLGNGQGTTTGTPDPSASATDTASPTDSASPSATTSVALAPRRVVKGDPVRVSGTGGPGCSVQVLGYTRPSSTYRVVRTGTIGDSGTYAFTLYPPSNTRVYAKSDGASDSKTTTVNVRFLVSMKVTRVGVRSYRFEGGVGPGAPGVHVTVYRSSNAGNVKVGTADTASNGAWSLVHQFSGSGTVTFFAVAETTANNDSNRSALVQTSVH
jgi:hypothetical protein